MKTLPPVKTPAEVACKFGCSVEQARGYMQANLRGLCTMLASAKRNASGKERGYTIDQLSEHISRFEKALADENHSL